MIELKYTIPKINGKELTWSELAVLLGYNAQIESEKKTKVYKTDIELKSIVDNSLTAVNFPDKKTIEYTELVDNPLTPQQHVEFVFQEKMKGIIFDLLEKQGLDFLKTELKNN